jgi:hypothetical protein
MIQVWVRVVACFAEKFSMRKEAALPQRSAERLAFPRIR